MTSKASAASMASKASAASMASKASKASMASKASKASMTSHGFAKSCEASCAINGCGAVPLAAAGEVGLQGGSGRR